MQFENQTKDVSLTYILSWLSYCFRSRTHHKEGTVSCTMQRSKQDLDVLAGGRPRETTSRHQCIQRQDGQHPTSDLSLAFLQTTQSSLRFSHILYFYSITTLEAHYLRCLAFSENTRLSWTFRLSAGQ